MKKLVATGALMAFTTMFAMAQDAQKGAAPNAQGSQAKQTTPNSGRPQMSPAERQKMMAEHQTKYIVSRFKLDEKQSKKIMEANTNFMKGMDELRASGKMADIKEREKVEAVRDAEYKKIMSEDQYKQYEATKRRPIPGPGQNAGGGKPMNAMDPAVPRPEPKH